MTSTSVPALLIGAGLLWGCSSSSPPQEGTQADSAGGNVSVDILQGTGGTAAMGAVLVTGGSTSIVQPSASEGTQSTGGQSGTGGASIEACPTTTVDNAACVTVGSSCAGTGDWTGWSCTCLDSNSPLWSCSEGNSTSDTACLDSTFDGAACVTVGSSCSGTGDWTAWSCACLDSNSPLWSCAEDAPDDAGSCSATTFHNSGCIGIGSSCSGTGDWEGWSCACLEGNSPLWNCAEDGGSTDTACTADTYDNAACSSVGSSCSGTGDWLGWSCRCLDSNSSLWSCSQQGE